MFQRLSGDYLEMPKTKAIEHDIRGHSYPGRHSLWHVVRKWEREHRTLLIRNRVREGTILRTRFDVETIKLNYKKN